MLGVVLLRRSAEHSSGLITKGTTNHNSGVRATTNLLRKMDNQSGIGIRGKCEIFTIGIAVPLE